MAVSILGAAMVSSIPGMAGMASILVGTGALSIFGRGRGCINFGRDRGCIKFGCGNGHIDSGAAEGTSILVVVVDASTSGRGHRERQWLHQFDLLGESAAARESAAATWAAKQWLRLFRARLWDGR